MMLRVDFPRTFDNLLDEWMTADALPAAKALPAMDVTETENEFVVLLEIPGVTKEDVKISVEKNILTIEGQRKPYEIPNDARVLLNEMRVRDFSRTLRIPDGIDTNAIGAELENGMLRVVLPKSQTARMRTITIK